MTSNIILDKALEAIDEKSYDQEWFSNMIINTDDAKAIIMELVDTQTIEMTQKQYNYFKWLRDTNDSLFEAFLTVSYNENELSLFSELDLAQAWLHPETVEVRN